MELIGNCPNCSREIRVAKEKGRMSRCPYCDEIFSIAKNMRVANVSKPVKPRHTGITNIDPTDTGKNIEITGVNIPFWKLTGFMLKWIIASIPSLVIIILIILVITHLFKEYVSILF
ncbi:MAG: hypothetical protein PVI26_12830 [Chitinispirillia bacterium]|jgi:hypothetical protein